MILRHCSDSDRLPPPCPSITALLSSKASRLAPGLGQGLQVSCCLQDADTLDTAHPWCPASLGLQGAQCHAQTQLIAIQPFSQGAAGVWEPLVGVQARWGVGVATGQFGGV